MLKRYKENELPVVGAALYVRDKFDSYESVDDFVDDLHYLLEIIFNDNRINKHYIKVTIDDSLFVYDGTIYVDVIPSRHTTEENKSKYFRYKDILKNKYKIALEFFPKLQQYVRLRILNDWEYGEQ